MHVFFKKTEYAFSLLEIIIAISIIAIFTVLPILAYSSYQKKARDDKRKSDISKITQALESYKAEKGSYPPDIQSLVTSGFLPEIPTDPLNGKKITWDTNGNTFEYIFSSPDGASYTLSAAMEDNGGTGPGGSGSSSFPGGNITGTFTGTGNGAIDTTTVSVDGVVTNNQFKGSFNGRVYGNGINGTINGILNAVVSGTAQGSVTGTATMASGTVNGTQFTGTYAAFNVIGITKNGGNGGGSVCISTQAKPNCEVIPVLNLTLAAQGIPTASPPIATQYIPPTIVGSITLTPSPSNTPIMTNTSVPTSILTPFSNPDLRVENITSDNYGFFAYYCNRGGNAESSNFNISIRYNGTGGTTRVISGYSVPSTNTCATSSRILCSDLGMPYPYCSQGGSVSATADSSNTVSELDETNNSYTKVFPSYSPTPTPSGIPCSSYQGHISERKTLGQPIARDSFIKSIIPKIFSNGIDVAAGDDMYSDSQTENRKIRLLAQRVTSTSPPRGPIDIYASGIADSYGRYPHMEFWRIYTDASWVTHYDLLARFCSVRNYGVYRWNAGSNNDYFSYYDQIYVSTYNGGNPPSNLPTVTNPGTLVVDRLFDNQTSLGSSTTTNPEDFVKNNCYYWNGSGYSHTSGPAQQLQCVGSNYNTNEYNWSF